MRTVIFDHMQHISRYSGAGVVYDALLFLSKLGTDGLQAGKLETGTDAFSASCIELVSKPEADCVFEAHRLYADIHLILDGVEGIGLARVETLRPTVAFDEQKDFGLYEGGGDGTVYLQPGNFLVCMPGEAHKVAIASGAPGPIRKVVVKIGC